MLCGSVFWPPCSAAAARLGKRGGKGVGRGLCASAHSKRSPVGARAGGEGMLQTQTQSRPFVHSPVKPVATPNSQLSTLSALFARKWRAQMKSLKLHINFRSYASQEEIPRQPL